MDEIMLGTIALFPYDFAPYGWALCNGALLNANQYPNLYSLIKGTYGGDGINNYMLPNLQGTEPHPYMNYFIAVEGYWPVHQ